MKKIFTIAAALVVMGSMSFAQDAKKASDKKPAATAKSDKKEATVPTPTAKSDAKKTDNKKTEAKKNENKAEKH